MRKWYYNRMMPRRYEKKTIKLKESFKFFKSLLLRYKRYFIGVSLGLEGDKKLSTLEEKLDRLKLDSEEEKKAIQVKMNDMEKLLSTKAGIEKMADIEKQQLKAQGKGLMLLYNNATNIGAYFHGDIIKCCSIH